MIRTRLDPIDRNVSLIISDLLSPEAQSKVLAQAAADQRDEALAVNARALGHVPAYDTFVDGRKGAALSTIKPNGVAVFEFELLDDVFGWIDLQLITHSPVKSGRYRKSHAFIADGVEVDPQAAKIPDAREYVYLSTAPYARKIERGLSPQAPEGVYQAVAVLAAKRFGNIARIKFGYRAPLFGSVHEWAKRTKLEGRGRRIGSSSRAEWLRRQPAIIITVT